MDNSGINEPSPQDMEKEAENLGPAQNVPENTAGKAGQIKAGQINAGRVKAGRVKAAVRSAVKKVTPRPFAGHKGPRLSPLQTPRVMVVANQKGGVGKTTTAINLATAMCAVGKTVLLIDLDPQGNASTGLGIRRADIHASTYDMLFAEAAVTDIAKQTKVPGLWVAPSSVHLSGAEIELVTAEQREFRLRNALKTELPYEYVIIDCPPSLNLLTLNAMVAADAVVVPLQCEFYALEGLSQLVKTVERVQKHYNPGLDIQGIVLTMYDKRNNLATMVAEDVRAHFGDKVYKTMIPRNVRVSEAPSFGLPAIVYDMRCTGSEAYIKLAGEVLKRERVLLAEKSAETEARRA